MQQQKLMLIDSMMNLITHISGNPLHQFQIYSNLSKTDVLKIISNFEDQNPNIRKVSAQLICELIYNNHEVRNKFLNDMAIQPPYGNIVLGKIGKRDKLAEVLIKIKRAKINMTGALCWYIPHNKLTIQTLKKGEEFIDPSNCTFGITNHFEQISEPLRFMESSSRWSAEKKKTSLEAQVIRSRAENNTMYVISGKKDLITSTKGRKQQNNLTSTQTNSNYSSLQSPMAQNLNLSSLKSPVIPKIRTATHANQPPINFQGRLAEHEGIYVPRTTRYGSGSGGDNIGFLRQKTRGSTDASSYFSNSYVKMNTVKR